MKITAQEFIKAWEKLSKQQKLETVEALELERFGSALARCKLPRNAEFDGDATLTALLEQHGEEITVLKGEWEREANDPDELIRQAQHRRGQK